MKYIYRLENTITGEFYIGKTANIATRMNDHKYKSSNKNVKRSMLEDGRHNHVFHILHCVDCTEEVIMMYEQYELSKVREDDLCMNIHFDNGSILRMSMRQSPNRKPRPKRVKAVVRYSWRKVIDGRVISKRKRRQHSNGL